jgi:hypothetical protein
MKTIRAGLQGLCFGGKDAIALALEVARHELLRFLDGLAWRQPVIRAAQEFPHE